VKIREGIAGPQRVKSTRTHARSRVHTYTRTHTLLQWERPSTSDSSEHEEHEKGKLGGGMGEYPCSCRNIA
jgi:hypothetical protein